MSNKSDLPKLIRFGTLSIVYYPYIAMKGRNNLVRVDAECLSERTFSEIVQVTILEIL